MELTIEGVSKTYPNGVQALQDVTLTSPAGMYGQLGPNGAGKSTLMRILATVHGGQRQGHARRVRRAAVDELRGRIWRRVISKTELPDVARENAVISTKLLAGRTLVRIYSETAPGPVFEPAELDLEDVYFSTMAGRIGRRPSASLRAGREQPSPLVAS